MTKSEKPTPKARFDSMPEDARKIVIEEAEKRGVAVELLFPDYITAQTADQARRASVVRLDAMGHGRFVIAEWFGVSVTAIINAIKGKN